jgi:hypothetical protein
MCHKFSNPVLDAPICELNEMMEMLKVVLSKVIIITDYIYIIPSQDGKLTIPRQDKSKADIPRNPSFFKVRRQFMV